MGGDVAVAADAYGTDAGAVAVVCAGLGVCALDCAADTAASAEGLDDRDCNNTPTVLLVLLLLLLFVAGVV